MWRREGVSGGTERHRQENLKRHSPVWGVVEDDASEGPSDSGNTAALEFTFSRLNEWSKKHRLLNKPTVSSFLKGMLMHWEELVVAGSTFQKYILFILKPHLSISSRESCEQGKFNMTNTCTVSEHSISIHPRDTILKTFQHH